MATSAAHGRTCALPWCNRRTGDVAHWVRIPTNPERRAEVKKHESVDGDPFFATKAFLHEGKEVRVCSEHCVQLDGVRRLDFKLLPLAQDPLWTAVAAQVNMPKETGKKVRLDFHPSRVQAMLRRQASQSAFRAPELPPRATPAREAASSAPGPLTLPTTMTGPAVPLVASVGPAERPTARALRFSRVCQETRQKITPPASLDRRSYKRRYEAEFAKFESECAEYRAEAERLEEQLRLSLIERDQLKRDLDQRMRETAARGEALQSELNVSHEPCILVSMDNVLSRSDKVVTVQTGLPRAGLLGLMEICESLDFAEVFDDSESQHLPTWRDRLAWLLHELTTAIPQGTLAAIAGASESQVADDTDLMAHALKTMFEISPSFAKQPHNHRMVTASFVQCFEDQRRALVCLGPDGHPCFTSELYPLSMSDRDIAAASQWVDTLKKDDVVVFDQGGATLDLVIRKARAHLITPSLATPGDPITDESERTRLLAAARLNMQRFSARMKRFRWLENAPSLESHGDLQVKFFVSVFLTRFMGPPDDDDEDVGDDGDDDDAQDDE
eukprot:m.64637 g.64637  ORF g.64637 m.64637 type:complete len:558 (+) comp12538_c0_seq2:50-1723(+)